MVLGPLFVQQNSREWLYKMTHRKACKLWVEGVCFDASIRPSVNHSFLGYKNPQNLAQLDNDNFESFWLETGRRKFIFFTAPLLVHSNSYLLSNHCVSGGGLLKMLLVNAFSLFWSTLLTPFLDLIHFYSNLN